MMAYYLRANESYLAEEAPLPSSVHMASMGRRKGGTAD